MKRPLPRGSPRNMQRMSKWRTDFSGYRHSVNEERIDRWLKQFNQNDRDLAARILDCVDFITHEQMASAFKSILNSLDGWNKNESERRGEWRFVSFSKSAGESGDTMLHKFRLANNLNFKKYNELFIYKSELLLADLGENDTVVFVDDFAGTGDQACEAWENSIRELLPGNPNIYLVLVATSALAREKIESQTRLTISPWTQLTDKDNVFSSKCNYFNSNEKKTLLKYCKRANKQQPKGYGNCGFVIIFAHICPNNSIPILHTNHKNWEGLFRRYD